MHQTSNFSCKRSFTSAHEQAHRVQPESSFVCRTLLAHGQVSLKDYSFHQPLPHHTPTLDKWSHRLLAPFRRQTASCVKEIHLGTCNKRGAGGQLMYVISSVSWLRSHSDSLTTLSRSERICRPHRVVKSAVSFVSPTISSVSPSGMWKASRCVSLCKMESSASCL